MTHAKLVLLSKKDQVKTFSDVKPISLSNFINKVISRVLHERLVTLLPLLISKNQKGFVKNRSIVENVLLAQEIVSGIGLRTKTTNVVIKLDMTKVYDRLSWLFITKVLGIFGFNEVMIDKVYQLLANNWYLVLINRQAKRFFKSTRGVKQGDHLL